MDIRVFVVPVNEKSVQAQCAVCNSHLFSLVKIPNSVYTLESLFPRNDLQSDWPYGRIKNTVWIVLRTHELTMSVKPQASLSK